MGAILGATTSGDWAAETAGAAGAAAVDRAWAVQGLLTARRRKTYPTTQPIEKGGKQKQRGFEDVRRVRHRLRT